MATENPTLDQKCVDETARDVANMLQGIETLAFSILNGGPCCDPNIFCEIIQREASRGTARLHELIDTE